MRLRDVLILAVGISFGVFAGKTSKCSPDDVKSQPVDREAAIIEGQQLEATQWENANVQLANDVRRYKDALERTNKQADQLRLQLRHAENELREKSDSGTFKSEYDLSSDDWVDLAKRAAIKVRWACFHHDNWHPSDDQLTELGINTAQGEVLALAYERAYARAWGTIEPACSALVGAQLAERLGARTCATIITESAGPRSEDDRRYVGQVRAGQSPAAPMPLDAYTRMLLVLTHEPVEFEADLSRTLPQALAHRLAFDDALGMCSGVAGPPPR